LSKTRVTISLSLAYKLSRSDQSRSKFWQRFSACWWAILLSMYWSVCHHQVRRTASSLIHRKGCSRRERRAWGSTSSIATSTSALNEGPGLPTVHAFTTRSPWW
jgi:hypothetical protein